MGFAIPSLGKVEEGVYKSGEPLPALPREGIISYGLFSSSPAIPYLYSYNYAISTQ
jgi:hypothetical protein